MKQNKYFSTGRFARLFRNDLLINQKTYLFTLAGLGIAIYALMYFLMMNTKHVGINQYTGFIVFYLMGVGVVVGTAFPALTNQIKTNNYLLAPGSTFEKYMVQFVIRIVIFIPIALLVFWISAHLAKASLVPDPNIGFDPKVSIADFRFSDLLDGVAFVDKLVIILSIFSFACLLFTGSVFFNHFALIKTLIVTALMVGAVILTFVLFSHIFYPAETQGFDIELKAYQITENLFNVQLAAYLLGGLSWLFFLPLAYFKLKEKEV
ncbi:MAG: hypothetical protein WC384_12775 [Prolixibacteraceae bacterium]|jgi:hypothetical protein